MITLTQTAAVQIRKSAETSSEPGYNLRIAARPGADGQITYGMGFDIERESDTLVEQKGIDLLIAETSKPYLEGVTLDYVELNPGEHHFIFIPPKTEGGGCGTGGCGGGGCGGGSAGGSAGGCGG
jgi:iron-sulfur cluster assembly protein